MLDHCGNDCITHIQYNDSAPRFCLCIENFDFWVDQMSYNRIQTA